MSAEIIQFQPKVVGPIINETTMITGQFEGISEFEKVADILMGSVMAAMQIHNVDVAAIDNELFMMRETMLSAFTRGVGLEYPFQDVIDNIEAF
ncbi:hypothetical protein phiOC_p095 [Ochrobactrum phage vB_OspM_OC]|nr:hypothetical protein phiOC_p095 [Ochrobactrum phage vB_OspM_OC]